MLCCKNLLFQKLVVNKSRPRTLPYTPKKLTTATCRRVNAKNVKKNKRAKTLAGVTRMLRETQSSDPLQCVFACFCFFSLLHNPQFCPTPVTTADGMLFHGGGVYSTLAITTKFSALKSVSLLSRIWRLQAREAIVLLSLIVGQATAQLHRNPPTISSSFNVLPTNTIAGQHLGAAASTSFVMRELSLLAKSSRHGRAWFDRCTKWRGEVNKIRAGKKGRKIQPCLNRKQEQCSYALVLQFLMMQPDAVTVAAGTKVNVCSVLRVHFAKWFFLSTHFA